MVQGWKLKHDLEMEVVAWHASLIRNPLVDKKYRMSGEELLGKKKKQTPMDISNNINKAWEMLNKKGG